MDDVAPNSRALAVVEEKGTVQTQQENAAKSVEATDSEQLSAGKPSEWTKHASTEAPEKNAERSRGQVTEPSREASTQPAQATSKETKASKKAERKSGEKRRTARAKRQQNAEAESAAAQPKAGPFSLIPIIGPVVGSFMP